NIAGSDTEKGSGIGVDIDTTTNEAGGFGAGLGYSSVAGQDEQWCGPNQQQGVAGGWFGLGFDVYGNYANSDTDAGKNTGRTRPFSVGLGAGKEMNGHDDLKNMIGLRGSGVRHVAGTDGWTRCTNRNDQYNLNHWYGMNRSGY